MNFPEDFKNQIICGDVVEVMKKIPDGQVDLVVTSPPYNLKNSTGNGMKDGRGGKWENAALKNGYTTMIADGLDKVSAGLTTLEELIQAVRGE